MLVKIKVEVVNIFVDLVVVGFDEFIVGTDISLAASVVVVVLQTVVPGVNATKYCQCYESCLVQNIIANSECIVIASFV